MEVMKEFKLIQAIQRCLPKVPDHVLLGLGDDAALLKGSRRTTVLTTDTQVDGKHFRLDWMPPRAVGERAVAVTLSDVAAMGAWPKTLVSALNLPADMSQGQATALARGIASAAERYQSSVVGGNVVIYDGPLTVTLTALGELPARGKALCRSGARPGDGIFATGVPGMARLGLAVLASRERAGDSLTRGRSGRARLLREAVARYLSPRACCREIAYLRKHICIHSLIDISDGLAGDLGHVLRASGVGAELSLPEVPDFAEASHAVGLVAEDCMLGASDDYVLLFTADGQAMRHIMTAFEERFSRPIVSLGRIIDRPGLWLCKKNSRKKQIQPSAYEHHS